MATGWHVRQERWDDGEKTVEGWTVYGTEQEAVRMAQQAEQNRLRAGCRQVGPGVVRCGQVEYRFAVFSGRRPEV